jgi:hypothetical protein
MFEAFTNKKFNDYLKLIDIRENLITPKTIRNSNLPPFIVNFFECYSENKPVRLNKDEFEEILKKAIIFNINYVIKPKTTLLKFLFGKIETKPCEFIIEKLGYFQFYSYYINHIQAFIDLNSPLTISSSYISHLIDEVNEKILLEISDPASSDTQRMNLIKLLYYYFQDLTKNNPINIKIPKKILSAFFQDKGFTEIKLRVDNFFSEEIFIQEAIELMKPQVKKTKQPEKETDAVAAKKILTKIKSDLLITELSDKEIEKSKEKVIEPGEPEHKGLSITEAEIKDIKDAEFLQGEKRINEPMIDQDIYSEKLVLSAGVQESLSSVEETISPGPQTADDKSIKIINELFCEETFKGRVIKKIFRRDIKAFMDSLKEILDSATWDDASAQIETLFNKKRVNYYSDEAIKFVDILQGYFAGNIEISGKKKSVENS